jgi:hypothetical protein
MFKVPHSRKHIEKHLNSNYQKINYNKFRWWRWYQDKNSPLPYKSSFRDKILNGDFDPSGYQWQAWLCEHMLNDLLIECDHDYQKYLEKGKLLLARRKRLLEDYEKDENGKLDNLFTHFRKYFKIDRREVEEEALKCCGELIDLFYIIKDNYTQKQYISKRGRPRKL